jgi:hypothetical protein
MTDVCAAAVGWSIKGEVARCLTTREDGLDEAEETALVDEIYESIPVCYQRCVMSFCLCVDRSSSQWPTVGL